MQCYYTLVYDKSEKTQDEDLKLPPVGRDRSFSIQLSPMW